MANNVTGILLAGGKSSRMGKDKALIKYGDETFISRSVKKLNNLFNEVIIVADDLNKYDVENVKIIKDIYPGMGPLGGIHTALATAKNDWIFVIPCDMPMWEPFLVEELLKHRLDYDAVVPKINNNLEPLFALYKKNCLPMIEKCLKNNVIKVIEFYPLVKANLLDLENVYNQVNQCTRSFFNINTPEDLYNMVKINGLKTDIELEKALKLLLENTIPSDETQDIDISDALGRVLCKDIYAPRNFPESQRSSVDGYVICEEDLNKIELNGYVRLSVIDEVAAGSLPGQPISDGSTQNIMTGAVLPFGSNAVIMHEHVDNEGSFIVVKDKVKKGQNIIEIGKDVQEGHKILAKGDLISPALISILAFNGFSSIPVYSKKRAAIISTGSELILPGEPYSDGKSYNSNMYFADSVLRNMGVDTVTGGIVPDNAAEIAKKLQNVMKQSDIVISFGGTSSGEYDLMEQALLMLGAELLFSGISIRPGKSFIAAKKDNKLFLGLSGSPGSAYNNLEILVKPVIKKMMGCIDFMPNKIQLPMPADYKNKRSYRKILQGKLYFEKGELKFNILDGESIFKDLIRTNILIDVPPKAYLKAGDLINAYYIEGMVNI